MRPQRPEFQVRPDVTHRDLHILAMGSLVAEQVVHVDRHPVAGSQGSIPIRALATSTGGGAANVAARAARLRGRSALVSCTGDGPRAQAILRHLEAVGVDLSGVVRRVGHDADLLILICDRAGDWVALEHLDPALRLEAADLAPSLPFDRATWFHVDGYAHHSAGTQDAVDEAIGRARVAGCQISVDAAVPSSSADPAYLRSLFGRADVAFVNEAELVSVIGIKDDPIPRDDEVALVDGLGTVLALGPSIAVLKRGADGSIVATHDGHTRVPAFTTKVVDTIGAGDAYIAAMLLALAQGRSPADAALRGSAAGALACRHPGSQGGSFGQAEVEALIAGMERVRARTR